MQKKSTLYVVQGAVIAAMYAALTLAQSALLPGSTSMAVQFRAAEALAVLAFFTPAAIPGLTVGCVIANISSVAAGFGFYDMIFGSCASFLAALSMYLLRNLKLRKIPVAGLLMPALFNGLIVGLEIAALFPPLPSMAKQPFWILFTFNGVCVALGELAVLFVLGIPLTLAIQRAQLDKKLLKK